MNVLLLTPKWTERPMDDPRNEPLCCVRARPDGNLDFLLSMPHPPPGSLRPRVVIACPCHIGSMEGAQGGMKMWGLSKIGESVWKLEPSIVSTDILFMNKDGVPEPLHAYVVLCDVPVTFGT